MAIIDIEHARTNARHRQSNDIVKRLHKTMSHEFYQVAFCKKIYTNLEELQKDIDVWLDNTERTHQGKMCCGCTQMQTILDGIEIWQEKMMA